MFLVGFLELELIYINTPDHWLANRVIRVVRNFNIRAKESMFKIIGTGKKKPISVYVDYKLFYFLKEFDEKIKSILTSTVNLGNLTHLV